MKKELTYSQAFAELEILAGQLEDGSIELETLAEKIKQANGLIEICESKLRKIGADVEEAARTTVIQKKK